MSDMRRKEIEGTGVFVTLWDLEEFVALQPSGVWMSFDSRPELTEYGWVGRYDRPTVVVVENGELWVKDWSVSLLMNKRYDPRLKIVRRRLSVRS